MASLGFVRDSKFGERCLTYSSYYFDNEEYKHLTSAAVLKQILMQWAEALAKYGNEDCRLFLPFNLDDEWVDCFKVTQQHGKLLFKHVRVDENGWALDVSDLSSFMTSAHQILKESAETYGEYDGVEIIHCLSQAKVVDDSGCAAHEHG